jgi:hypothetical protein
MGNTADTKQAASRKDKQHNYLQVQEVEKRRIVQNFIQLELPLRVCELREGPGGGEVRGRVHLQVAERTRLNLVELEMVGVEETEWELTNGSGTQKIRGASTVVSERVELCLFNEGTEYSGQYCFPFLIKLAPDLPSSMTYFNPGVCGARISYTLTARFKVHNPHDIQNAQNVTILESEFPILLIKPVPRP